MGFHQGEAYGNIASEGQAFFYKIRCPEQITPLMQHNKINLNLCALRCAFQNMEKLLPTTF